MPRATRTDKLRWASLTEDMDHTELLDFQNALVMDVQRLAASGASTDYPLELLTAARAEVLARMRGEK